MGEATASIGGRTEVADRWSAFDAVNFLLAAIQTAFGTFVPAYLSAVGWNQAQIGVVLTVDTLASMASQVPAGALVDAISRRRELLAVATVLIGGAALLLGVQAGYVGVFLAVVVHSVASSATTPAIAAISLLLVGHAALGERLGRNARFAAIGAAVGAGLMAVLSGWTAGRGAFLLAAMLTLPALWALRATTPPPPHRQPEMHGHLPEHCEVERSPFALWRNRNLMAFMACVVLFHLANAAIVPLALGAFARRDAAVTGLLAGAFVIVPQAVVALASPAVGRAADRIGRQPLLLVGYASLPLRAALFAVVKDPLILIVVEALEGVGAAVFGVLLPLVTADLTRGTGCFNAALGVMGLAVAAGAAASTSVAGTVAHVWGVAAGFWTLTALGLGAVAAVALLLPETRPRAMAAPPLANDGVAG